MRCIRWHTDVANGHLPCRSQTNAKCSSRRRPRSPSSPHSGILGMCVCHMSPLWAPSITSNVRGSIQVQLSLDLEFICGGCCFEITTLSSRDDEAWSLKYHVSTQETHLNILVRNLCHIFTFIAFGNPKIIQGLEGLLTKGAMLKFYWNNYLSRSWTLFLFASFLIHRFHAG